MRKKDSNDGQLSLFEPAEEKIIKQEYSDIMKQSYIDYASSESKTEMKKKEYLSVIAFFLDHYKIGTRTKLLGVLKNGYAMLKKEIGDNNAYDLLRDYMNESLVVQRAEEMPDKYGVRFKFHLND